VTSIAVVNQKGGVGKTTVVLGLASAAAHRGIRLLSSMSTRREMPLAASLCLNQPAVSTRYWLRRVPAESSQLWKRPDGPMTVAEDPLLPLRRQRSPLGNLSWLTIRWVPRTGLVWPCTAVQCH